MVLGLTTENIELIALIAIGVFLVIGLVSALVIKAIVGRLIALVLMVGLAALVWSRRASISDCTNKAKANYSAGVPTKTTCTFFGRDVEVDL